MSRSRHSAISSCKRAPPAPFAITTRSRGRPASSASRTGWIPTSGDIIIRVRHEFAGRHDRRAASPEIPDKLYFRIGDVARLAGIKPYVLRFWETEFPGLGPKKSGTGHRLYRRKDVEMVLEIKRLLYEQRFTIEGARKFLETRAKPEVVPAAAAAASASASSAIYLSPIPAD